MSDRHHNAPPLNERLELDYGELMERAIDAANQMPPNRPPIASEDDAGEYAEDAAALKRIAADIEKARKREKESILADGRTVDAFFAAVVAPVKLTLDKVLFEINVWQRARLEAERKAAKEREETARKAAALFDEPAPPPAQVLAKDAGRVTSASGVKATATLKWVFDVEDFDKVPRHYLMLNEGAVKAAIAGGVREIAGLRIYEDIKTSIR